MPKVSPICPICSTTEFKEYNNRPMAMCSKCGAFERGRLAWMMLEKLNCLREGVRFLNLAPEPFMIFFGAPILKEGYTAADYDPSLFSKWNKPIMKLDLCHDIAAMKEGSYDVIMHNHVMEHVPCAVPTVLSNLNRLLSPGGYHLISVPIRPGAETIEDLDPNLSEEERKVRFGQSDHMRIFGEKNLFDYFTAAGMTKGWVNVARTIKKADLKMAGIPGDTLATVNSNRVFAWKKPAA